MSGAWISHGEVPASSLAEARNHLHWAAQVIPAVADAYLDHAADDSHSNMRLEGATMWGRPSAGEARVGLDLHTGDIVVNKGAQTLRKSSSGASLPDLLAWLEETLSAFAPAKALVLRDYDMPPHPAGDRTKALGELDSRASRELSAWFQNAKLALLELAGSEDGLAVWPHHFDLGGIQFLDTDVPSEKARQIGFGLSPGDHNYQEPYYYVTPWPIPEGAELPTLEGRGHWHREGFVGAILAGSKVENLNDSQEQISSFLSSAISAGHTLIPEKNS